MPEQSELPAGQTQPLSRLWERRTELSGFASANVRTSALAGLTVTWLFAGANSGDLGVLSGANRGLLAAAAFFAASLAADILHYYLGAEAFRCLARRQERDGKTHDDPVAVPTSVLVIPAVFYNAKVGLLFVGYAVLVGVFVSAL